MPLPLPKDGFMQWVSETPPPESGILIGGFRYFFHENPKFAGLRIEQMKRYRATAGERMYPNSVKAVNPFSEDFFEKVYWSRISKDPDSVLAFIETLTAPSGSETEPTPVGEGSVDEPQNQTRGKKKSKTVTDGDESDTD